MVGEMEERVGGVSQQQLRGVVAATRGIAVIKGGVALDKPNINMSSLKNLYIRLIFLQKDNKEYNIPNIDLNIL